MKNKEYSLQLLTHKSEIFATREDAIEYFEVNFRPNSLIGEPALAFYGDQKSPKAIMAIGVADKKVFYIDTNKLSESIDDVISKTEDEEVEITNSLDLIKNIITACGLTLDENKKTNRVTYDTDVKDDVIGNAKSLSEAINLLSKFIQKGFKDNELKVDDTESIKLSYKPDATDGKKLTAEVKLSNNGDSDDTDFNDNIICKKSDGLYAAANLEYDEEKHTLTFTSSGYKDGKYKDDAHKKVINLDEHTIVSTENHHHNIELVINKIAGTNKYVISGDVRLSEDENNILKIEDDHLIVDGRAKNIKYGDITVAKGLNNLKDRCDDLADKIDNIKDSLSIDGTTTDTFEANVVKGTHGFTVSGDVRLSNDTSVKVSDGGLSVNVDIDVDTASNQLTLKVGNRTKIVSLPGIQIVKNIRYDEKTASIVIELTDSSTPLTIPVSDMIETIYVQNDASSAVELHKHEKEGEPGRSYLSATVKLKTSGNILAKDPVTGELYVPETAVSNAVAVETNRALEAERTITEKVNTVSSSITDEVERAKEAERVLSETDNTIKNEITSVKNNLETEKTARESFDNNIKTIVDGHTQSLSDINSSLDDVKSKITDETSARELADTTLQSSIDANKTAVDKEVARAKEAETAIASNVAEHIKAFDAYKEKTDSKIADLTQSDNDIKGLIADKVADINNEISATNTKVTKLEGDTSKLSTDVNDEVTRAKAAELTLSQGIASNLSAINDEINRSTNKDTELENKISSHIEAYTEYKTDNNAKVSVLQNAVKAIETDVAKKYNDLDAKDNQTISDYKASDVTLQSNIDKEVVRATTEEGKINSALTDEVARAKAKETELSDMVNSLDSDYKAADTQLKSTIDGLTTDLTNEVNRATEAENKIKSDLTVEINKKVASVTIEKNSTSDLQYTLYVDGKPSGEVNIPKDQLLTNVEYLAGEKIIRFTFETTSGVKVTDVNVADLVDTYIAGDGLTLVDNKFSVKKSDGSQPYLEVTADGVKVVGVDEALALKANAANVYTKDEIEAKGYLTEHQDISSFVTKDELAEVKIKTDANTSAVTDEVTRAKDAESNLNVAIKANETSITNEVTRATNAEKVISDKLNEHLADVKEYKKSVDTAIDGLRGADTAINEKIATNLSDTKASIESVKTDYKASDVTLQSNIDKEVVRATTEEGKINSALTDEVARAKAKETELKVSVDANSDAITKETERAKAKETELLDTIKDNATKASFVVNKSNTINLTKETKDDGSSVLTGNVEISTLDGNLLKNDQPLYASVDLTYDAGTNTLKFNSSALETEKVIKLNAGSVIDRMYYDAATEELVIVYTNANGEQSEVRFSARTLFNKWDVQKEHLGGIILNKQVNKEGTDILSGAVVLSTLSTNALINDQGSLYVSNQAKDYNLADGTSVEKSVSDVKNKVTDLNANVTVLSSEVAKVKADEAAQNTTIEANKAAIETVENDIQRHSERLDDIDGDIAELKAKSTIKVADTNTVHMNSKQTADNTVISCDVKLANYDENLIMSDENGLYFSGTVDYGTY